MAENWQSGDLAMAIGEPSEMDTQLGYRKGAFYSVQMVGRVYGELSLAFHELPMMWRASAFRKIPPHTPDAEDEETIRLLNGAPVEPVA